MSWSSRSRCAIATIALSVLLLAALWSFPSSAAGFYYADLGARELGRGATGAAGTGDISSIVYNPAGLADLDGLTIQIDLQLAQQHTSFTRSGGCGAELVQCATVSDSAGLFANTLSGIALNLGVLTPSLQGLVVAIGARGPPAVGIHHYPDPNSFGSSAEVAVGAPQRYSLISSNNFVFYPGLHVGWRALDWLSLGAGAELRIFNTSETQSIFSIGGISGDYPDLDAIATVNAHQYAYPVFDGGIIVRPIPGLRNLSLGLSGHLGAPVSADGTIDITVPSAAQALNLSVQGNGVHIDLRLPSDARLGLQWKFARALVEIDQTWEGWGAIQSETVTPIGVSIVSGTGANKTTTPVAPFVLRKDFHGAFTTRIGGEWMLPESVAKSLPGNAEITLRAGGLYETSAIPDETLQVDFVDGPRFAGTLGFTIAAHGLALTLAYEHYFQSERDVTDSTATRATAAPSPPFIIGNGVYQTSLDAFAMELTWHGLAH